MAHPRELPWYVADTLGPDERQAVDEHLDGCEECRVEAERLAAIRHDLVRYHRRDHIPAEQLVAFANDDPDVSGHWRGRIERHLSECPMCREDVELARQATPAEAGRRFSFPPRGVIALLASAAMVTVAMTLVLVDRGSGEGRLPGGERTTVTFAPISRSMEIRKLVAPGPWTVMTVLPATAPRGDYRTLLLDREGAAIAAGTATSNRNGQVRVPIDELPPGAYRLVLTPVDRADAEQAFAYPFEVEGMGSRD